MRARHLADVGRFSLRRANSPRPTSTSARMRARDHAQARPEQALFDRVAHQQDAAERQRDAADPDHPLRAEAFLQIGEIGPRHSGCAGGLLGLGLRLIRRVSAPACVCAGSWSRNRSGISSMLKVCRLLGRDGSRRSDRRLGRERRRERFGDVFAADDVRRSLRRPASTAVAAGSTGAAPAAAAAGGAANVAIRSARLGLSAQAPRSASAAGSCDCSTRAPG